MPRCVLSWACSWAGCENLLNDEDHTLRRHYCDEHREANHIRSVMLSGKKRYAKARQYKIHKARNTVGRFKKDLLMYLLKTNKQVSIGEIYAYTGIRKESKSISSLIWYYRMMGHYIVFRDGYYYYGGKRNEK